jgi:beta-mannosidase
MATLDLCGEWLICGLPDGSGKAEELAGPPCSNRQQWLSGNVPGTIQTDLFRLGRKPPPFLGKNTKEFADLEDMEWWYRKSFIAPKSLLDDRVELVFDGLDTLADVWLNGKCLAHHENMFVPLRVDVTDTLAYGEENVLVVRLRSVAKYGASLAEEASAEGRGGFSERSFVRKAQFAFHWDWAARLVTVGICAPVRLESYRGWRVMDLCVRPFIVFKGKARLAIAAEFERVAARPGPVQLALSVFSPDGELLCHQERIVSAEDSPDPYVWNVDVEIAGPQLWWPNGYGEQPLYTVAVTAACDEGEQIGRASCRERV